MKKIKYILISIFLFLIIPKVNALTYNGALYEVYYSNSGVNVFAKDTTYESMDYNGWIINSSIDNRIYYCIEPELYMQSIYERQENTHSIYEGDLTIINNSRLDNNTLNKIKLLAYYGYGYKDKKIDHTDKKWYGITQVMIWRVLRPDINFVFKTSRFENTSDDLYVNEVNELNNLVNNYNKVPSFSNTNINLSVNEEINLTDNNDCLHSYYIDNSEYYSYNINGNTLTIKALKEGSVSINLKKQRVNNDFILLKGNSLQDIITRGDINNIDSKLDLNVKTKSLKIIKKDYSSKEIISNVKFSLYKSDDTYINDYVTDSNGEILIDNLSLDDYYLLEKEVPKYYKLNTEKINFSITKEDFDIKELEITNEKNRGTLKFIKIDQDTKLKLKDTEIEIYYQNNELLFKGKTDSNGMIILDNIEGGMYYLKEINPSYGYMLNNEIKEFEIIDDKEVVTVTMENKKIEIPDTYTSNNINIIIFILLNIFVLIKKFYEKSN